MAVLVITATAIVVEAAAAAETATETAVAEVGDVAKDAAAEVGGGEAAHDSSINWPRTLGFLSLAGVLIIINGFFVAAEFALVKIRISRLQEMADAGKPAAGAALWLAKRLDKSLSACQLGITMASLALGWVGEPAFAALIAPALAAVGVTSETVIHITAFAVSFAVITGLHLVVGEQFPKIFAIRKPGSMLLWCAWPMRLAYVLLYPFLWVLDTVTAALLRLVGIEGAGHGEAPSTENELRQLLSEAHRHGTVTGSEHSLIQAVFEFDDMKVSAVMLPRTDVVFFDVNEPVEAALDVFRRTKHTRYPLCDRSLDAIVGVVHVKDLLAADFTAAGFDLRSIARPQKKVPETMPVSKVLRHFQSTRQLMAFVVDEHGIVVGVVTLEQVLEQIVGEVDDEFDEREPNITAAGPGEFLVDGGTTLSQVARELNVPLTGTDDAAGIDTLSGLLMERTQKIPHAGDVVELDGARAEVVESKHNRATVVRMTLTDEEAGGAAATVTRAELAGDDALLRDGMSQHENTREDKPQPTEENVAPE